MQKYKALRIIFYILVFLFFIELIPSIALLSSKDEQQLKTISSEYRTVTGVVENYHYYTTHIRILINSEDDLKIQWFHTLYDMSEEYQNMNLVSDIYEGMTLTIIYYPDINGNDGNEYYEIAGLYSSEKTYIDLEDYLQIQEDDLASYIVSGYVHLGIDVTFFIGAITCMVFYIKLNRKQEEVNEKINYK